jgi:Xaa-Pro aminopeptidase
MRLIVDPSVFSRRRERVMAQTGPRAVVLLPGAQLAPRNGDSHFRFRQDSDFYYLTGFEEPDAFAVLAAGKFTLFVRPRDPEREVWDGRRAGVEGAIRDYGAHEAFPITELETRLPGMLADCDELYYALGRDAARDTRVTAFIERARAMERRGAHPPRRIADPRDLLGELRLVKEEAELAVLRRAAEVTAIGHEAAMGLARAGVWEYEIEAAIEYAFRRHGARGPGYTTIVGAGPNGCILHYIENTSQLADGQLLLVDAGAEYDCYTADVTRTVPVGGKWTSGARKVYDAVLASQEAALAAVRPGATLDDIHARALEVLVAHLHEWKLCEEPKEAIEKGSYRRFYMHRTSHWLGLDVHDAGSYRQSGEPRRLEPGYVLTVEPGLYFPPDAADVPEELRGIGVRIEDDVLVTPTGGDVLTKMIPKRPADLDRVVAR